jgi:dolichyl-diphosphooligosaccharide--protein glycosyltransferase/undecaprenyl-diphosphooligosaccharide--protein glycosyltransferase
MWNNELMINTNDGYFWAEGARDILSGVSQPNDLSPINRALSQFTAAVSMVAPVSFETLILWMPAVFGGLIVVPMMLIGRLLGSDMLGFLAALLSSITVSYYNRTMIGYYDTDFFMVTFPLFVLWGLMYSFKYKNPWIYMIAPIIASYAIFWHDGQTHLLTGITGMALLYTLIFARKEIENYQALALMAIGLTSLPWVLKIGLIVVVGAILAKFAHKLNIKVMIGAIGAIVLFYLFFGGFGWIAKILASGYIVRFLEASELDYDLKFFHVLNTVRETGAIPFEDFAVRISGHVYTFWVSMVGFLLLLWRYKIIILSLPMMALGLFALQGGLRFTIFAVPLAAFGIAFLVLWIVEFIQKNIEKPIPQWLYYGMSVVIMAIPLYPNVMHAKAYMVPTVFNESEVQILDKLGQIAGREDYVLSWWDYGYLVRYYSDVKTLIDGGKHSGGQNFTVSFSLARPQIPSANMARYDVEYTERGFEQKCGFSIECMLKDSSVNDPVNFLKNLDNIMVDRPEKTRDIYYYLPLRMLDIFPTVAVFSNIDLRTGKQIFKPFYLAPRSHQNGPKSIDFGSGVVLHKEGAMLQVGDQSVPVRRFVTTEYNKQGQLQVGTQEINPAGPVSVVYMKNYNRFVLMDEAMYNSAYIQLFVLENVDNRLFEPVLLSPLAKVFKLKI